jgi:hypothetical protein
VNNELSYWIGLIVADGYLATDRGRIRLSLSIRDRDHVSRFHLFMGHTKSITIDRNRLAVSTIDSLDLWLWLRKLGVHPGKSGNEVMPDKLIASRDAWRGWVDGDGCLTYSRGWKLFLRGSVKVLQQFNCFVRCSLGFSANQIAWHDGTYCMAYHGMKACAIAMLLYDKADPALERKYEKALEMIDAYYERK